MEILTDSLGSLRIGDNPRKTITAYKLMRLVDGKLYPLYIDRSEPVAIGVWYNADSVSKTTLESLDFGYHLIDLRSEQVIESRQRKPSLDQVKRATAHNWRWFYVVQQKTKIGYKNVGIAESNSREEVKADYALRPGWHCGSLPVMNQIGKGANHNLRDDSFVWTEIEISADVDYNAEAKANGGELYYIPTDGYYLKCTNANKKAAQADKMDWYIAGAIKINRIISDSEARQIIDRYNREHGTKIAYDYQRESGKMFNADTMSLEGLDGRRVYGGNSGYQGYSKSNRAVDAEKRGLRSKSQMDNDFADKVNELIKAENPAAKNVTLAQIKKHLDNIHADEWYHTSKFGNQTNYYSAQTVADYFYEPTAQEKKSAAQKEELERRKHAAIVAFETAVYNSVPHIEKKAFLENAPDVEMAFKFFETSNGDLVVHTRDVFRDSVNIDILPKGKKMLMRAYGDWQFENADRTERAKAEYNEAKRKAREANDALNPQNMQLEGCLNGTNDFYALFSDDNDLLVDFGVGWNRRDVRRKAVEYMKEHNIQSAFIEITDCEGEIKDTIDIDLGLQGTKKAGTNPATRIALAITIEKIPTADHSGRQPQGEYTPYKNCQPSRTPRRVGDLFGCEDIKISINNLNNLLKDWKIDDAKTFAFVVSNNIGAEPSIERVKRAEETEEISYYLNLPQYSLRIGLHNLNAENYKDVRNRPENHAVTFKKPLDEDIFKPHKGVNVKEYVYVYWTKERLEKVARAILNLLQTGVWDNSIAEPDYTNPKTDQSTELSGTSPSVQLSMFGDDDLGMAVHHNSPYLLKKAKRIRIAKAKAKAALALLELINIDRKAYTIKDFYKIAVDYINELAETDEYKDKRLRAEIKDGRVFVSGKRGSATKQLGHFYMYPTAKDSVMYQERGCDYSHMWQTNQAGGSSALNSKKDDVEKEIKHCIDDILMYNYDERYN